MPLLHLFRTFEATSARREVYKRIEEINYTTVTDSIKSFIKDNPGCLQKDIVDFIGINPRVTIEILANNEDVLWYNERGKKTSLHYYIIEYDNF